MTSFVIYFMYIYSLYTYQLHFLCISLPLQCIGTTKCNSTILQGRHNTLTFIIAFVVIRKSVALSLMAFILEVVSLAGRWSSSAKDLWSCVPWFIIRLLHVLRSSIFVLSIFIVFSISVGSKDFSTSPTSSSSSSSSDKEKISKCQISIGNNSPKTVHMRSNSSYEQSPSLTFKPFTACIFI